MQQERRFFHSLFYLDRATDIEVIHLVVQSSKSFVKHDMSMHAAALAYHILFSLFPFIIFLLALLSYFDLHEIFASISGQAQLLLPPPAMVQINMVFNELQAPEAGLLSTGAVVSLWLASRGMRALMAALNVVFGAAEARPAWKRIPVSLAFTLALAAMVVVAGILMTIGPRALQWLSSQVGLKIAFMMAWTWLRWPVALLLLVVGVACTYYAAPNVCHRFRLLSPGAVLCVIVWIVASVGFGYYVEHFSRYSVIYGSIGAVIVLLLYLYLSAAVLLFGAEVNAAIEREAAASEPVPIVYK